MVLPPSVSLIPQFPESPVLMLAVVTLAEVRAHICLKLLRDGTIPLQTERNWGPKNVGQTSTAFFLFLCCFVAPDIGAVTKYVAE